MKQLAFWLSVLGFALLVASLLDKNPRERATLRKDSQIASALSKVAALI